MLHATTPATTGLNHAMVTKTALPAMLQLQELMHRAAHLTRRWQRAQAQTLHLLLMLLLLLLTLLLMEPKHLQPRRRP